MHADALFMPTFGVPRRGQLPVSKRSNALENMRINMRPMHHPTITEIRLEGILHALSDPARAAIFAEIAEGADLQTCKAFAGIGDRIIPKSSLSQHFKVLREAGLIRSERHGIEMRNASRCDELEGRFPGLIAAILHARSLQIKTIS
jgi:DNA-binding transcriptional ArsR family regulator